LPQAIARRCDRRILAQMSHGLSSECAWGRCAPGRTLLGARDLSGARSGPVPERIERSRALPAIFARLEPPVPRWPSSVLGLWRVWWLRLQPGSAPPGHGDEAIAGRSTRGASRRGGVSRSSPGSPSGTCALPWSADGLSAQPHIATSWVPPSQSMRASAAGSGCRRARLHEGRSAPAGRPLGPGAGGRARARPSLASRDRSPYRLLAATAQTGEPLEPCRFPRLARTRGQDGGGWKGR